MIDIFTPQNWVLIVIGLIWMFIAVIQDFRKREVANWWNFSLIIIVLVYRGFVSIFELSYWYFLWGLIGLGVGFILANIFYYARMFAGGDAKLMYGVFAILPLSFIARENLQILVWFLLLFLIIGSVYGGIYSIILMIINFKKFKTNFVKLFSRYKIGVYIVMFLGIIGFVIAMLFDIISIMFFSILIFISPALLLYAKAVENCSMIRKINTKDLTIGDWLAKDVKVGGRIIKEDWEGISEKDLKLLKKHKGKVLVKYGIPFTPTFLIGFIVMLIIFKYGLNLLLL